MARAPVERFVAKLARNEAGCLIYTGATQNGYGTFSVDGKSVKAHRFAWESFVGPIPDGHTIDHECHNIAYQAGLCSGGDDCPHRACCDPEHLVPRLAWENVSRGGAVTAINARKEQCPRHEVDYLVYRVCPCCRTEAKERHQARP